MGMKKRLIAALIAGMMLIQTAACGNNAGTPQTAWIAQSQYRRVGRRQIQKAKGMKLLHCL